MFATYEIVQSGVFQLSVKKKGDTVTDQEMNLFYRIAKKKAIAFARINSVANATLSQKALMDYPIRNSGMTCEDILQELWIVGIKAYIESESEIEVEARSYALNAMDWKVNELAESIYRKKRGAKENHVSGADAEAIFEGTPNVEND